MSSTSNEQLLQDIRNDIQQIFFEKKNPAVEAQGADDEYLYGIDDIQRIYNDGAEQGISHAVEYLIGEDANLESLIKQMGGFLVTVCHGESQKAGWWTDLETGEPLRRNHGEMLMLIVSELAEAMEADRKDLMDDKIPERKGIEVELADAVIRICDMAGALNLDLGGAVAEKLAYNAQREDHKPENRKKEGGKRY